MKEHVFISVDITLSLPSTIHICSYNRQIFMQFSILLYIISHFIKKENRVDALFFNAMTRRPHKYVKWFSYMFMLYCVLLMIISEPHRPRQALQGEKVSLKIHRADLIDR